MKAHSPRSGSMQFWPRKRAKSEVARLRSRVVPKEPKLGSFAGYKVGMVHVAFEDIRPNSISKGKTISWPATIIECPPLTAFSIKLYKNNDSVGQVFAGKFNKHLSKKYKIPKSLKNLSDVKEEDFDDLRLIVHTNPSLTGIGKKKPEVFEIGLGGKKEEKINAAKEFLGKDISLGEIFKNGQLLDMHAITKGKGFQGPVKRFGIGLTSHRAEKARRNPGSLGGWKGQAHFMYRIAHAGQTGYHQRTEYNKRVLKIGEKAEEINPKSGFKHYGLIKNSYILVKGSVAGPSKRLIRFNPATRPNKRLKNLKDIEYDIRIIQ